MFNRLLLASLAINLFAVIAHGSPPGNDWRLTFADEFSGTSVDSLKWDTRYSWGRTHNHLAYMQDENVVVNDGILDLNAKRESAGGKPFTSGMISSHNKFRFSEGYAEMNIKMPTNRGSWPAFWMLNSGWPPEIDIMEYPLFTTETKNDTYAVNSFWGDCCSPPSNFSWIDTNTNLSADFHTFGLEWNSSQLKYYFDGQLVKTASNQPEFENMYLIFNYAVGGWPGTPSTSQWANGATDTTQADWIRVWQKVGDAPDTTWSHTSSDWGSWGTDGNWSNDSPNWESQTAHLPELAGKSAMEIRWGDNKNLGNLIIEGNTIYTLGQAGGAPENLMFSDSNDGWSHLWVNSGAGGHIFNSRLDAWSNLSIKNNGANALILNGDIRGQTRKTGVRSFNGGRIRFESNSSSQIVVNGDSYLQSVIELNDGVHVTVNGNFYVEDSLIDGAAVLINDSTLRVGSLNAFSAGEGSTLGSLGYLPAANNRIVLDNGVLEITGTTITERGFTIGAGGATLSAESGRGVTFNESISITDQRIASVLGGDLTLTGRGLGRLNKALGGTGGLIKSGTGIWHLGGLNSYTGTTIVEQGTLVIDDSTGRGPTFVMSDATLQGTGTVRNELFVNGDLDPSGVLSALNDVDFMEGSRLLIDLDTSQPEQLTVLGEVTIDLLTELVVSISFTPTAGDQFEILTATNGITGNFSTLVLPDLGPMLSLNAVYTANTLSILVESSVAGDYNANGIVDAADYTIWRDTLGQTGIGLAADGNGDNEITAADYQVWRDNYDSSVPSASNDFAIGTTVPEPTSVMLLLTTILGTFVIRGRIDHSRRPRGYEPDRLIPSLWKSCQSANSK